MKAGPTLRIVEVLSWWEDCWKKARIITPGMSTLEVAMRTDLEEKTVRRSLGLLLEQDLVVSTRNLTTRYWRLK